MGDGEEAFRKERWLPSIAIINYVTYTTKTHGISRMLIL